jgi:hypothetical protein
MRPLPPSVFLSHFIDVVICVKKHLSKSPYTPQDIVPRVSLTSTTFTFIFCFFCTDLSFQSERPLLLFGQYLNSLDVTLHIATTSRILRSQDNRENAMLPLCTDTFRLKYT